MHNFRQPFAEARASRRRSIIALRLSALLPIPFLLSCGGSGGGGPVNPIGGVINATQFTIPAGTTRTVTSDLTVNASQGIQIDGTLVVPEGVDVSLISSGSLNVTGKVTAADSKTARVAQPSRDASNKWLVFAGASPSILYVNAPRAMSVAIVATGSGSSLVLRTIVGGDGIDSTSSHADGGPGGNVEIGTDAAKTIATGRGATNVQTPQTVTVDRAVGGRGGSGYDDSAGVDDGTTVTAVGTKGGKGGDLNIASIDAVTVTNYAFAGTGGRGGACRISNLGAKLQPREKGRNIHETTGDGGDGGSVRVSPLPSSGIVKAGTVGLAGSATAVAENGGPDGGFGGDVDALIGLNGQPGSGASADPPSLTNGYFLSPGNGAPSTDAETVGGEGGTATLASRTGGQAPAAASVSFSGGSGGGGFGGCSKNPPPGTRGGLGGDIVCHGLAYTIQVTSAFAGGNGGDGNGPGAGGPGGSDDSGKKVGPDGSPGKTCSSSSGKATFSVFLSVPSSNASFGTFDPASGNFILYAADPNLTSAFSLNVTSGSVTQLTVPSAITPVTSGMANLYSVSRETHRGTTALYVSSNTTHSIQILNEATGASLGSIPVSNQTIGPNAIAFDPGSGRLYAATDQGVDVFDTKNGNNLVGSVATVALGDSMALNPSLNRLYVSNFAAKQVVAIDTSSLTVVGVKSLPDFAGSTTVDPTTGTVYTTLYYSSAVLVLSPDLSQTLATVTVGTNPWGVAVDSQRNRIYVANFNYSQTNRQPGTVTEIDGATNAVLTTVTVGKGPLGLVVDEAADKVYVADSVDSNVAVLNGN